ncbi:aminomethyl-transferring glycine dehydrogenase subunit GcvPA [Romboutsia sp.]|uniref:aminomethyl-transferring glycine dehydrogenase subunit GcvPA n=1 Tax=Romboutsia sp. TaxID=1965302 RepID=UPI003F352874
MEELKYTTLYETHKEMGAKFLAFSGWDMPLEYESMLREHNAVRERAGLFDVSHMGEVLVEGIEAEKIVQNLVTNDIKTLNENQVIYTLMCYEDGGVVDDLLVYKYNSNKFLLVINAGNIDKDISWIRENSKGYNVEIKDICEETSQLAIQGPKAQEILQKIVEVDLNDIEFFYFRDDIKVCNLSCMISRTGYTGEDGFEIYCENKYVKTIWNEILKAGKEDIKPIGLGARDTLRFEACLPLYGNEINENITPLEGGISYFVKLDKSNFIGKEALVKQKQDGLKRKLVGFELLGKGIARQGYEVKLEDKVIGLVTTGYSSPTLNKAIGLALIDSQYANLGTEIDIVIRKKLVKAKIISKPFYKKQYKKETVVETKADESNNEYSYIPTTKEDKLKMLEKIGVNSVEDLFNDIPKELRLNRPLKLENGKSELEVSRKIKSLGKQNINLEKLTCFLGAGAYDHYIPSLIKHITSRSEFYTAYTPYQAEISQGTLQVIFEFQSMITELTGMEIANASMYDGATAAVEACLMAAVQTKRNKIIVSKTTHPETRKVLYTYARFSDLKVVEVDFCSEYGMTDINKLKENIDKETACVLVQNPNFFGIIEEMEVIEKIVHANKALLVMSVDPISLGVLRTPGEIGADIVVGEAQALGNPTNFGGPYVGFLATKSKYSRKMPGRIVGQSIDTEGKKAYVLTLQAREQHVRREKATSNICSNQALNALTASIYMATLGKEGFKEVGYQSMKKAHYTYNKLVESGKYKPIFKGKFFKEFALLCPTEVGIINNNLLENNILGGYNLENYYKELKDSTLICVTEKRTKEEIDKLVETLCSEEIEKISDLVRLVQCVEEI